MGKKPDLPAPIAVDPNFPESAEYDGTHIRRTGGYGKDDLFEITQSSEDNDRGGGTIVLYLGELTELLSLVGYELTPLIETPHHHWIKIGTKAAQASEKKTGIP